MKLIVLMSAVTMFFVVWALLYGVGKKLDLRQRRLNEVKGGEGDNKNSDTRLGLVARINQAKKKRKLRPTAEKKQGKKAEAMEQQLEMAGIDISATTYALIKVVVVLVLPIGTLLICRAFALDVGKSLLIVAVAGILAIMLPDRLVKSKTKKRQESLRNDLPDVMDLLVVSVEAGLGFDAALLRLYEKNKSPVMTELMQVMRDVQRGRSKKEAYARMTARCGIKELSSFASAVVQSEALGISMKSVLKSQSEELRRERKQRAEEKAMKAPIKMMIPMVLFIFPIIFIILLAPAALNIIEILG